MTITAMIFKSVIIFQEKSVNVAWAVLLWILIMRNKWGGETVSIRKGQEERSIVIQRVGDTLHRR
jgi:hypothetical protein